MEALTLTFENKVKAFAAAMAWQNTEAQDIEKAYFASDASSLVAALPTGGSGASLDTKLTKDQYQSAIGFAQQVKAFFANSAVSTGDYLTNIEQVIYGNAVAPAKLSDAAEDIANRLNVFCRSALTQYQTALGIIDFYGNSELSVLVAGLSGGRICYGASMNATQLTQGITLVEQYKKMIGNESVATGLYSANVAIWLNIGE